MRLRLRRGALRVYEFAIQSVQIVQGLLEMGCGEPGEDHAPLPDNEFRQTARGQAIMCLTSKFTSLIMVNENSPS